MGIAMIVPGVTWADKNLGSVTPSDTLPVQAIAVDGAAGVMNSAKYNAILFPVFTSQRSVVWSISSGSEYAAINQNGVVTAKVGAMASSVTIRATSADNPSVYGEKVISVTFTDLGDADWLQSDGACYLLVDGLSNFFGGRIIVRATLPTANGYAFGMAYGSSAQAVKVGLYRRSAGDVGIAFGTQNYIATGVNANTANRYRVEMDLSSALNVSDARARLYNDETDALLYTSGTAHCYVNTDFSLLCYGYCEGGVGTTFHPGEGTYSAGKFYGMKVYDSDSNLVRDIQPKTANGVAVALDNAQGKIYYNLGAGTLTAGND